MSQQQPFQLPPYSDSDNWRLRLARLEEAVDRLTEQCDAIQQQSNEKQRKLDGIQRKLDVIELVFQRDPALSRQWNAAKADYDKLHPTQ